MNKLSIDLPMPISTPRLVLRPFREGDGVIINEAIIESFDVLHRYMDWAVSKPSVEESEQYAREAAANWILKKCDEPWLPMCIIDKFTNQLIGATGFHSMDEFASSVSTGYWIRASRSNEGFITEAVNALTQYAFKQLGVKRIAITCDRDNIRSKRVPERLGYILEDTLTNHRKKPVTGEESDTLVYARYDLTGLPHMDATWGDVDA
jgi:ribosomal-protein-serine acetyltransferase